MESSKRSNGSALLNGGNNKREGKPRALKLDLLEPKREKESTSRLQHRSPSDPPDDSVVLLYLQTRHYARILVIHEDGNEESRRRRETTPCRCSQ